MESSNTQPGSVQRTRYGYLVPINIIHRVLCMGIWYIHYYYVIEIQWRLSLIS